MLVLRFYLISNEFLLRAMLDPLLEQFREETQSPLRLTFMGLTGREERASNSQWPLPWRNRAGWGERARWWEWRSVIRYSGQARSLWERSIWFEREEEISVRQARAKKRASWSHRGRDALRTWRKLTWAEHNGDIQRRVGGQSRGQDKNHEGLWASVRLWVLT